MTHRGLPPIDPSDLRDHATPERIDRVWRRVAADISHGPVAVRPPRGRYWVTALAATLAAFAAGMMVGKGVGQPGEAVVAVSSPDVAARAETVEVFAAGTRGRNFTLPGGGSITLSPGSTVELVERSDSSIRLRLVQGEATVDTAGAAPSQLFDIVAEDAVLSTRTGSALRVSRTADELDVSVSDGEVEVRSPSGSHSLRSGERAQALPLRTRPTAAHLPVVRPHASVTRAYAETAPLVDPGPAPVSAIPDWRAKREAGDWDEAYRLLNAPPSSVGGAIASATTAGELMELSDVVIRNDPQAAIQAWTRIVDSFPNDDLAQIAAFKLGSMYERIGQPEQARIYLAQVKGELAQDAFCQRIRTAATKEEAIRVAGEYLIKYPDGRCREEAERVAAGEGRATEDDPPAAPAEPAVDGGAAPN